MRKVMKRAINGALTRVWNMWHENYATNKAHRQLVGQLPGQDEEHPQEVREGRTARLGRGERKARRPGRLGRRAGPRTWLYPVPGS